MTVQREILLCRYHYDPLDRVASCIPLNEQGIQRYYRKERFATEVQGQVRYSLFEHQAQVLAQQRHEAGQVENALLATDLQRSVLHSVAVGQHQQPVYSPYGHRSPESGLSSLLGFNGERRDPVTGHYLLGNGYRSFNPLSMRFNSPDSLSPFGKGGVNAYVYCVGDPINRTDPQGRHFLPVLAIGLVQGAGIPRFFRVLDAAISIPAVVSGTLTRGVQAGLNAVNKLRPSSRSAARYARVNTERLDSISDFTKRARHITDRPPFAKTIQYAENKKAAVKNFIGPRHLENGPSEDFAKLVEDQGLADATLQRVTTDYQNLNIAENRMKAAIENWRSETGFGMADHSRLIKWATELRRGT
jgi:RHS repeat-associated protein